MSVRTSTVGPSPFLRTPTTPVPPTFSVTSKPKCLQLLGHARGRVDLVQRQLRVGVQMLVQREQVVELGVDALLDGVHAILHRVGRRVFGAGRRGRQDQRQDGE